MNVQAKRTKYAALENANWVSMLSKCIDSIGAEGFGQNLVAALNSLANFDHTVVFAYHHNEKPHCLYHSFLSENRPVFVDDYLNGPYLLDPFFQACGRKVETGLYRLRDIAPDRFYQSEYYRSYYVQTGLSEEVCYTFYLPKGVAVVISLMRAGESQRFSVREFRLLESVALIVVSLAKQHWQDISESFDVEAVENVAQVDRSLIVSAVSDLFGKRITPREKQVVAQVLEGHSSESIARDLGISVGTVRIHRRNVYAKLQISSQQELFSIFFEKIKPGQRDKMTTEK